VAEIIPIDEKIASLKNKKNASNRKRKIQAVQNVFRCVRCAFKCEKCGAGIELKEPGRSKKPEALNAPYNFCQGCREEYVDYIDYLKGKSTPENYWHNDQWGNLWRRWIEYQSALDGYLKSKEFKALLMETREPTPDEEG
jgi:hypothetical protein